MSWLDDFFRSTLAIRSGGSAVVARAALNFLSAFTLTDNPTTGATDVSLNASEAGDVDPLPNTLALRGSDGELHATALVADVPNVDGFLQITNDPQDIVKEANGSSGLSWDDAGIWSLGDPGTATAAVRAANLIALEAKRTLVTGQTYTPPQTITYAASVTPDFDLGGKAKLTLGGNVAINAPSHALDGGTYILRIVRGAGGETVTWDAAYVFTTPSATPNAGASAVTVYHFESDGTKLYCVSRS